MPNPYVNKVVRSNGTTLIDISDTTAVASDVVSGKYFYLATGEKVEGTGSGGSTRTTVIPEQSVTVSTTYTQITNYVSTFTVGEEYIITLNGVEYKRTAEDWYGSVALLIFDNQFYLETTSLGNIFLDVNDTSMYGTYTLKVEQESGGGGTSKNTQTVQSTERRNNAALGSITSLTCSKAGTYDVYWVCSRSSTSGTWGSQLYINGTAYDVENTTFSNHVQTNHLSNVTIPANATVAVYGRSRSGYYIYAPQLTIVEA